MKRNFKLLWLLPVAVFGVNSCGEKTKETTDQTGEEKSTVEEVVESVKEAVTPEVKPSISVEERAAKLGFAKYLPADTEMMLSVYNSKQAAEQLKALKMYELIAEYSGMDGMGAGAPDVEIQEDIIEDEILETEQEPGEDLGGDAEMAGGPDPWTLLGQEVTIATGASTGVQLGNLLKVNQRMAFFQARAMGRAAQTFAKNGSMEEFSNELMNSMEGGGIVKSLLKDPESGVKLLDQAVFPPFYIAFRAKDGELEQAAQLVNSSMAFFGMVGEMAAPVELETAGSKFAGYKLLGAKLAEVMEESREDIEEDLGAETTDALLSALTKKNLIVVSGTVGDYVVLMIGGDEAALKLVESPADSLVGTSELNFTDPFVGKQLLTVAYGDGEMLETIVDNAGGIATYALGLREGISGGQNLGDTRDIEQMLQMIADREKALLALASSADTGMVAFVEDGLKIESFGGYDKGGIDWNAKTKLAHLGDSGQNLMFLNFPSDAVYDEKLGEYVEVIFETAYAMTMKFSSLNIDVPELAEMKGYTQMFNEKFRDDVVGIYDALSGDFSDGLGYEKALVIDLNGSVPAVPGLPQEIVDGGKAPRITFIAPVTDRSKLVSAWKNIDTRSTSLLATVSEMAGEKIPMQKPISSEKDGMTTWFIAFPFFQDDFLPSVTVSDEWFAASTSKTQAVDLIGRAAAGGEEGEGVKFYINFAALSDYADEMLDLVEKNAGVVFTNEFDLELFNQEKEMFEGIINASREFDSMTWNTRKENGYVRSSIYFKTR